MKKILRETALAYRQQQSTDDIQALSKRISAHLYTLLQTFSPCTVGLFHPTRGEPDLMGLLADQQLAAWSWALPVCSESPLGPVLKFAQFKSGDALEPGRYNIPVPKSKTWVEPELLVIPCLGYHADGSRLGYGAGWYDRTLNGMSKSPVRVGVAYAATEFLQAFAEPHDHLLDYVVTENGVTVCRETDQ